MNGSPATNLLQIAGGAVLPRCLHAVANIGIADILDETPQSARSLAAATGTSAEALDRVLRLLAANGVFEYRDGLYHHSAASRLLRADHPRSLKPEVRMFGSAAFWQFAGAIEYSIRTGLPAAGDVFEGGFWNYLSSDSEASRIFDEAMTSKANSQRDGILEAYDFSGFQVIGDIGGGRGHFLRAVLERYPHATGILFDQPRVIQQSSNVTPGRLKMHAGDFLNDDLPVCDAYLIMEVIHNWDDERAIQILRNVRSAAPMHARVLLMERIVPSDSGPGWPKTMDIWMLVIGGKQRTQQEYASLLAAAGLRFTRRIDTRAGVSIIEAAPAD
jgi:hypothetical protein